MNKLIDMSTFDTMSIGKEIRRERRAQDMTQKELAEIVGRDQRDISLYENGKGYPSKDMVEKIAKALGKEWKLV